MIPVMIIGSFISGKKYSKEDYASALLISLGSLIFLMSGSYASHATTTDDSSSSSSSSYYAMFGLLLVLLYLFFDGFTSTLQEKMFSGYTMSTYQQMLYTNAISVLFSVIALRSDLFTCIHFSIKHPDFFLHSLGLSLCAALGQVLIYTTIKEFGALIFATIMTTRQLLNIILSCIIYRHPLTLGQWFGMSLVIGIAYYKADSKSSSRSSKQQQPPLESSPQQPPPLPSQQQQLQTV